MGNQSGFPQQPIGVPGGIEASVVGAKPGRQRVEIEEILIEAVDLEEEFPGTLIEVEGNEAVVSLEARCLLGVVARRDLLGKRTRGKRRDERGGVQGVFHDAEYVARAR